MIVSSLEFFFFFSFKIHQRGFYSHAIERGHRIHEDIVHKKKAKQAIVHRVHLKITSIDAIEKEIEFFSKTFSFIEEFVFIKSTSKTCCNHMTQTGKCTYTWIFTISCEITQITRCVVNGMRKRRLSIGFGITKSVDMSRAFVTGNS